MARIARFITASAAVLAAATPLHAQTADQDEADDIVVSASRIAQKRSETGQSITVVDKAELDRRQTQVLSDVLQTLPGVSVARNGGPGGVTSVFIRGGDSSQTLVLVDGVRINDPSSPSGAFDFSSILTGNIGTVEVLRGPNSVIWGSQAIGGVINITTIEPSEGLQANARGEYGYRDTGQLVASVSGKSGIVSGSVGGSWFRSDGISSFDERSGGTEKDGFENVTLNGKLKIAFTDAISLDLRGFYTDGETEFDNPPGDTLPVTDSEQFVGYAGLNVALFDGRLRNRIAYTRTDIQRITTDPAPGSFNPAEAKGTLDRFEYQGVADVADALTLVFGIEHERSEASTFFPAFDTAPDVSDVHMTSYYGQAIVRPVTGLTLTGGVRVDDQQVFGSKTSLGGNIAYTPNGGDTVLRATYAEGFRAPALSEQLAAFGNPNLRPETARSYDAGIEQSLIEGKLRAQATYFRRNTRDLIVFSSATFSLENIAAARSQGVELGLWMQPVQGFTLQAQYSLVDTENRSTEPDFFGRSNFGNRLARRAKDSASVLVDWQSPWGPALGATVLMVGDTFDDVANTIRLDSSIRVDLRASFAISDNLEVYGRVENLFDEAYQTAFNYGVPGRAGYAGVRLKM
ncbi:TonB-dependent receptor plug domain-containing protein [Sphingomonas sp. 35-24ZXX]|uniref:TonB-dependent receptor plug domain-containing protein n=1 Tax=Sphingomonas sp. 35-24ZXX TaxID=1545915 RepID=UPI000A64B718|nr:TonB-dependent receptor [Sphingomonas sp. 35-24ZXX]